MSVTRTRRLRCLIVLTCLMTSSYQNATLRDRIPIYLQELCPGSGVCLNDAIDPGNDATSCCGVCSCSDDCEVDGNCCFLNQYEQADDNTAQTTENFRECLHPIIYSHNNDLDIKAYHAYSMITSEKYADDIERTIFTVTCGDIRVAPWGSMYPVYSAMTGEIYKNQICADAYNVTDGEVWKAFMSCESSRFQYDAASFVPDLRRSFIPDMCSIQFVFDGDKSLLKPKICYRVEDYNVSCIQDFKYPTVISTSKEDIADACKSGLISPFNEEYANIFCYMCQQTHYTLRTTECSDIDGRNQRGQESSFTIILDPRYISTNVKAEHGQVDNTHMACKTSREIDNQTDRACRMIQCPSGQTLSPEYKCIYPGNTWIVKRFFLRITLSSERNFSIYPILDSWKNLKSPWPKTWEIDYIAYATTEIENQALLLMVLQSIHFYSPFNPKTFFTKTKENINRPWFLLSSNHTTVQLNSKISKFKIWSPGIMDDDMPTMRGIYRNAVKKKVYNVITELYFCEHVTLLPSEYSSTKKIPINAITNKITNETLFNGEFTVVYDGNGIHVEVCLSKSGLYRVSANDAIHGCFHITVLCLELLILYQTLLITVHAA